MSDISKNLLQRMQADGETVAALSLDEVRIVVRAARDLEMEINEIEERLKLKKTELQALKEQRLVEVFTRAGVKMMELDAEGNLPPYKATLKPFYAANIAAAWDEERRGRAFSWLSDNGHGDLIKWTYTIELGRDSEEDAEKLRAALDALELGYQEKQAINHNSLTAWFKDACEQKLPLPELEVIGAQRGQHVEVKPVKEKSSTKRAKE